MSRSMDENLSKMLKVVQNIPRDDLEIFAAEMLALINDQDLLPDDMFDYMIETCDDLLEKH